MKMTALAAALGLLGLAATAFALIERGTHAEERTSHWANGRPSERTELTDGVPHGLSRRWHADGSLAAEGRYADGKMEGAWQFWRADGTLDEGRSGTYVAGERQ
jgi:antitoxin component YwqK of YwqJK toxin-antitoxin module